VKVSVFKSLQIYVTVLYDHIYSSQRTDVY